MPRVNYKFATFILLIIFFVVGFYWWQLRPAQILAECANKAHETLVADEEERNTLDWQRLYDLHFETCRNRKGID